MTDHLYSAKIALYSRKNWNDDDIDDVDDDDNDDGDDDDNDVDDDDEGWSRVGEDQISKLHSSVGPPVLLFSPPV